MTAQTRLEQFDLQDRYTLRTGVVLISGIQALVRALQTRARLDHQRGLRSGGFVSGYRGSPLGGLDKELWAQAQDLEALGIHFQPGINEDLAATAVWGSQQVGLHPGATVQGAFGMWYGKAPGLDRSCDAIRHANSWGTSATGGVLMVVGDDPAAKSSSLATQSEFALQDMMVPVLAPSDVQDVLDFAVLGWEMSRYSGLWVSLKAIADHMDSAATVQVADDRYPLIELDAADVSIRREDSPIAQEQRLLQQKLPRALAFARRAQLNRWVTHDAAERQRASIGVICAGKAYRDLREACALLGLHSLKQIRAAGLHVLKLGMTWPLDDDLVRDFAVSVDTVLVLEEKRAFVEPQVKQALYPGAAQRFVPVLGKTDLSGAQLLPSTGILNTVEIARVIAELLPEQPQLLQSSGLLRSAETYAVTERINAPAKQERTPLFCAGCPHNTSTRVPDGSRATAGIGCHYMVQWMGRDTDSCTHMGGEGVTWVGESPFTDEPHLFANLGDGTYFHSGVLAIRQAVAAGVNITYKILFNDAVAMTGGQPTDGELSVADVVAQVRAEGVQQIVIVSDEPSLHEGLAAPDVRVRDRRELDEVQRELRQVTGVSVLIYQQTCATELRRRRKRGLVSDDRPRLLINEAICEGCGDCSVQSNCVAVEPVETEFGIKRRINQTNCNKDLSCAEGYCPAFVQVSGDVRRSVMRLPQSDEISARVPAPEPTSPVANILITGVGGTGIVTVSALLAAAARIDGCQVRTLDMTGLAQKGGAVFAHVRIGQPEGTAEATLHSARIPDAAADVVVACDLISAAADEALALMSARTQAVVNSHVTPTADFVLSQSHDVKLRTRLARIRKLSGTVQTFAAEDHVERVLGDTQQANIMLLGHAYQLGGIPLSIAAIEQAITLNAVAVERNLLAFHLGRLAAHAPAQLDALGSKLPAPRQLTPEQMTLEQLIEQRSAHLVAYQGESLAGRYRSLLDRVAQAEQAVLPGAQRLTRAVAQTYAQLLAVKDEYEVARLYAATPFQEQLEALGAAGDVRYLLAPPLLGGSKRRFGPWMKWVFRALARVRRIRNTWLDPFAHTSERRQARTVLTHYEQLIDRLLSGLTRQNLSIAVRIVQLSDQVRGFGHVKAAHFDRVAGEQSRLMEGFTRPPEPVRICDPSDKRAA